MLRLLDKHLPAPTRAFLRWRNGKISDLAFQRWSAANPLTRPISRRKIRQQFALNTGFVQTQIMTLAVELGLLDKIKSAPGEIGTAHGLLPKMTDSGLTAAQLDRLLKATTAIDLTVRLNDGYMLSQLGASLQGSPGVQAMVLHHKAFYEDLRNPLAVLKMADGGTPDHQSQLSRYWGYAQNVDSAQGLVDESTAPYSQLMVATQEFIAHEVIAAYDFSQHETLLDVGGNEGRFLMSVGAACPEVRLHLFDLPSVVGRALAQHAPRLTGTGGSFFTDPLPASPPLDAPADCISFVRVLHDHDDSVVESLLAKAFTALAPGGTLVIAEPLAEVRGAEEMGDAYFGFYLAAMSSGRPRPAREYRARLESAGFTQFRQHATRSPLLVSVLSATKPNS